jgi:hypothetical protein
VAQGRVQTIAAAVFVGLAGVVGFGGGHVAAGAQEQPDACKLFSRREAKTILGKPVRRETSLAGTQASTCGYVAEKDARRVVGLASGELASEDEASKAYARARADAQFDGLKIENVRRLGQRAYWLPITNNFERTVVGESLVFGELTVLEGRRVYTVYVAPPSKTKARDAINLVTAD